MENKLINKLNSYLNIAAVCDAHPDTVKAIKGFSLAYDDFSTHLENIQTIAPNQGVKPSGAGTTKRNLRTAMCELAAELASATGARAARTGNRELSAKVAYSFSDLFTGRDTVSADKCRNVLDAVKASLTELVDYDIDLNQIKELGQKIAAYRAYLTKPRQTKVDGKAATLNLNAEFDAADQILNHEMDALLPKLQKVDADFVTKYETARQIVDIAATHAALASTLAPTPVTPK